MERAHSQRTTAAGGGGGGEFFICFTARLSSSSTTSTTRIPSSKSLMSPGRTPSLNRRLRSSGSIKGAQSPMFPSSSSASSSRRTKGGAAFEPAEPSSPKVTCIGQVRVKSKKKKNINGAGGVPLAPRSHSQREASFRRERDCPPQQQQQQRNTHHQSWVYQLPLSICEALRSIGSEVNCFVPCRGGASARSPCSGKAAPSSAKRSRTAATSSCGAVFARWLMAIEEERDEVEVKDVEILEMEEIDAVRLSEKKDEVLVVEEEEEGRVSVCIPPRNALLLMRCRSDPARVAALADRFWGSPAAAKVPCQEECGADEEVDDQDLNVDDIAEVASAVCSENAADIREEAGNAVLVCSENAADIREEAGNAVLDQIVSPAAVEVGESNVAEEEEEVMNEGDERTPSDEAGILEEDLLADHHLQVENTPSIELKDDSHCQENEAADTTSKVRRSTGYSSSKFKDGGRRRSFSGRDKERRRHSFSSEREARRHSFSSEQEARRASFSVCKERGRWSCSLEKEELTPKVDKAASSSSPSVVAEEEESNSIIELIDIGAEAREPVEAAANKPSSATEETQIHVASAAEDGQDGRMVVEEKRRELPDCLLQMMYEPKLSMEVSKETWVCSTDFLRWRPHHPQRPSAKVTDEATIPIGDNPPGCNEDRGCDKRGTTTPAADVPVQPPTPPPHPPIPPLTAPALPIASAVEQKCTGSAALVTPPSYGPLLLTRCNSEPVRSSASLAPPDACFWKSRHCPIGAAGIGF